MSDIPLAEETSPAPQPTSTRPTASRLVYVYCPERWDGHRPAIITTVLNQNGVLALASDETESLVVNVSVFLDAVLDDGILRRSRPDLQHDNAGDILLRKFSRLTLYDPLKPEQRPMDSAWAEWMPYQAGQAKKTQNLEAKIVEALDAAYTALERLNRVFNQHVTRDGELTDQPTGPDLLPLALIMDELDPTGCRAQRVAGEAPEDSAP